MELYAVRTEQLPDLDRLRSEIAIETGTPPDVWERMRTRRAKESLAGILLLQAALREHKIPLKGKRVARSPSGRPFLPETKTDFNITHTAGLAICAFVCGGEDEIPQVGVDAERMLARSQETMRRIAVRWFLPGEQELFRLRETEECFLTIWTGKEAMVKRTGEGLSGIRRADTTLPLPSGDRLTRYRLPNAVVSLCCGEKTVPPEQIRFLPSESLLRPRFHSFFT